MTRGPIQHITVGTVSRDVILKVKQDRVGYARTSMETHRLERIYPEGFL
jgi:hypothetical protein